MWGAVTHDTDQATKVAPDYKVAEDMVVDPTMKGLDKAVTQAGKDYVPVGNIAVEDFKAVGDEVAAKQQLTKDA